MDEKGERPRTLKKVISEVSVDSDGFPSMLKTAEDEEAAPPCDRDCVSNPCERDSVFVSSLGTKTSPEAFKSFEKKKLLRCALGYEVLAKRPATVSSMCKSTPDTNLAKGPWVKLQKTIAKKSARSYILGSLCERGKTKVGS